MVVKIGRWITVVEGSKDGFEDKFLLVWFRNILNHFAKYGENAGDLNALQRLGGDSFS